MTDPRKYFRLYLLSLPELTAIVGDRIQSVPVPLETAFPFVGYDISTGSDDYEEEPLQEVSATVFCYAKDKAGQASRELFFTLQNAIKDDQVQIAGQVLSGIDIVGKVETFLDNSEEDVWYTKATIEFSMDK
jgi:hypothetical protein